MVKIAVTAEAGDEPRVAISPETVKKYTSLGCTVMIEKGAGERSRFSDAALQAAGAEIASSGADAIKDADVLLTVARPSSDHIKALKPGAIAVAMMDPVR